MPGFCSAMSAAPSRKNKNTGGIRMTEDQRVATVPSRLPCSGRARLGRFFHVPIETYSSRCQGQAGAFVTVWSRRLLCEHLFVTEQGSAYARFRRALDSRNATVALAAATELDFVSLPDALELVLLLVRRPAAVPAGGASLARPLLRRSSRCGVRGGPRHPRPPRGQGSPRERGLAGRLTQRNPCSNVLCGREDSNLQGLAPNGT